MLVGCVTSFIELIGGEKLVLSALSLALAVASLYVLKRHPLSTKLRISVIYSHLFFLIFPVTLFTTDLACGALCMPCQNNLFSVASYALPTAVLFTVIAGFVVVPAFYIFSNKTRKITEPGIIAFVRKHAQQANMNAPHVYAVNKAQPLAFSFRSFRSGIFLSVGLLELLRKKEKEAVILHELAHLKQRSSALKFSGTLMRLFSPLSLLARFHHDTDAEEQRADSFVAQQQGTGRYLASAKRKIDHYNRARAAVPAT